MKRIGLVLLFLSLVFPLAASAHWHDSYRNRHVPSAPTPPPPAPAPKPPPTPTPPPQPTPAPVSTPINSTSPVGLCFNYGHDTQTYDLSANGQVAQDLNRLSTSGIKCLRLAYNGFNNPQSESLASFARARGFYIILGGDWGELTSSQLTTYDQEVIQEAKWAQANGIPEIGIGNEQENGGLSGITLEQWAVHLSALATEVRQVYSGRISYSLDADYLSQYEAAIPQAPNLIIGLNTYGGYHTIVSQIESAQKTWGAANVEVSETNCDIANIKACQSDMGLATEVRGDLLQLLKQFPTTPFYAFTWRSGATAPAYWGLVNYPQTLAELGIK